VKSIRGKTAREVRIDIVTASIIVFKFKKDKSGKGDLLVEIRG